MGQSMEHWQLVLSERATIGTLCAFVVVLLTTLRLVYRKQSLSTTTKDTETKKERQPGEWTPVPFSYPAISACEQEICDMKPIPYRPFRGGEYHVTMGIRSMPWNEWIELDNEYETYHRIRKDRIRTRGKDAIQVLPETPGKVGSGQEAAVELVHELAEYLSRRYPKTFQVERLASGGDYGWDGAPAIKRITVIPLNETYELPQSAPDVETGEKALELAALLTQDDVALMIEGADGKYYFQGGAICIPGFWRMRDKIGLPLEEIHLSGNVPRYESKLQKSMERYFQRLAVDKPVARNNYGIQVIGGEREGIDPEELAWSVTTNGPEEEFAHERFHEYTTTPTISQIRLRSERQTLRRLPGSGAIVFTIRVYLTAIEELSEEEGERLGDSLLGWGEDIGIYKGKEKGKWFSVLIEYLNRGKQVI